MPQASIDEQVLKRGSSISPNASELKSKWIALVRGSARSVGRANSNIRRYLGDTVVDRQIDAIGSHGLRVVIEISQQATRGDQDRAVVSRVLSKAKARLKTQDVASLAALSAVNQLYGQDAT